MTDHISPITIPQHNILADNFQNLLTKVEYIFVAFEGIFELFKTKIKDELKKEPKNEEKLDEYRKDFANLLKISSGLPEMFLILREKYRMDCHYRHYRQVCMHHGLPAPGPIMGSNQLSGGYLYTGMQSRIGSGISMIRPRNVGASGAEIPSNPGPLVRSVPVLNLHEASLADEPSMSSPVSRDAGAVPPVDPPPFDFSDQPDSSEDAAATTAATEVPAQTETASSDRLDRQAIQQAMDRIMAESHRLPGDVISGMLDGLQQFVDRACQEESGLTEGQARAALAEMGNILAILGV